jgi:hypothetical protein
MLAGLANPNSDCTTLDVDQTKYELRNGKCIAPSYPQVINSYVVLIGEKPAKRFRRAGVDYFAFAAPPPFDASKVASIASTTA